MAKLEAMHSPGLGFGVCIHSWRGASVHLEDTQPESHCLQVCVSMRVRAAQPCVCIPIRATVTYCPS